ncbi:MAG: ISKra4 family transposase, partial [Cyanobacteria bacterium P01_D01_bin.2]
KQIDARLQLAGAQWKTESLTQVLKLRCAYLNEQLDVISSVRE